MAEKKKKSTAKSTSGKAKTSQTKRAPQKSKASARGTSGRNGKRSGRSGVSGNASREMQGVICAALGLLVLACLFIRKTAAVPEAIAGVIMGLFGIGGYLVPVAMLVFGIARIVRSSFDIHAGKTVSGIVFALCICGLIHLALTAAGGLAWTESGYFDSLKTVYNAASQSFFPLSMGAVCAAYVYPLVRLFGVAISAIILVCGVAVSVILLFNFSYREMGIRLKKHIDNGREQRRNRALMQDDLFEEDGDIDGEYDGMEDEREAYNRSSGRFAQNENTNTRKKVKMFDDTVEEGLNRKHNREVISKQESPLSIDEAAPVSVLKREFNEPDSHTLYDSAFNSGAAVQDTQEQTVRAEQEEYSPFIKPTSQEPSGQAFEARPEEAQYVQGDGPEEVREVQAVKTPYLPTKQGGAEDTESDPEEPEHEKENVSGEFNSFDLPAQPPKYVFPPLSLLPPPKPPKNVANVNYAALAAKLERTLASFGIRARVINYTVGPAITRYELTLEEGIRVNKILNLSDDIALAMAATGVRIEAPIPGKSAIGIEIPNVNVTMVCLREVLDSDSFRNNPSCVAIGLGKDITGRAVIADIAKMPHLLIAGQTGSGKSVAINSLIVSLLYKATPDEVRLILVDPKQVELSIYNGIPHLLLPVVTDPKKAAGALQYVVRQMEKRYSEFSKHRVKDIYRYNEQAKAAGEPIMPRIVVIVDELNDLMMVCPGEVEDSVLRIAQLARAAGIYLVLATQRPSVNVITGVIKANIPSRMAFAVASSHDSKTILDRVGAERLVGKGDMLYHHNGESKPLRIQGAFVDEPDIEKVVEFIKGNSGEPEYIDEEEITMVSQEDKEEAGADGEEGYDELIFKAVDIVMQTEQASISMLQRKLGIGYARAGRLIDAMEKMRIIGPSQGSKPREILITQEQYIQNFKRK